MLQIPAIRLRFPTIAYSQNRTARINERLARWNLDQLQFIQRNPVKFRVYLIAVQPDPAPNQPPPAERRKLFDNFNFWAGKKYNTGTFEYVGETRCPSLAHMNEADRALKEAVRKGANFVILLQGTKNVAAYSNFKTVADRLAGVQSLCLLAPPGKDDFDKYYWGNVMMKVNLKAGGINHTISGFDRLMQDTLVLGA